MRDTLTVCFLGLAALGALALLVTGTPTRSPTRRSSPSSSPPSPLGQLAGGRVFARLAHGGRYEPVADRVLLVAVVVGLIGAL